MTDLFISVPDGSFVQVLVNGHAVTNPAAHSNSDDLGDSNQPWDLRACYDESYVREVAAGQRATQFQDNRPWDLRACDDESFIDDLTHGRLR
ncbi:MAG: hypothetical protein HY986_09595 [Candidatus Melainabacteria bacterium]|nr:hypothetical protein [Candidatus Melainabacteria bacterium]